MDDRLASLLRRFALRARVFQTGMLCRSERFDATDGLGYIHVLRGGSLRLSAHGVAPRVVREPCVLFMPSAVHHRLQPDPVTGADLVCASIDFGAAVGNPLTRALPPVVVVPIVQGDALAAALGLLFDEAAEAHCGRQAVLDRLAEVVIVLLFRHLMDAGLIGHGVLAGLADDRLMKAITAMHDAPAEPWTLNRLAAAAGMSRARFAARFRDVVGETPAAYLAGWRVSLAQALLDAGRPVNVVAGEVGYDSASALARVFRNRTGVAPTTWQKRHRAGAAAARESRR